MLYQLSYVREDGHSSAVACGFRASARGNQRVMLAVALAAIVVGIVFLFVIPWVGIPVGIVGLLLLGLWLIAFTRKSPRAAAEETAPR